MSSNFMQHAPSHFPIIKPEPGMERSVSPHGSEHSHYSTSHQLSRPYPSPGSMQAPMAMSSSAMSLPSFPDMSAMPNMHYQQVPPTSMTMQQPPPIQQRSPKPASKNFPCRTCGKPFARRSDLVRHERIHSGVRPHVCDHADCGKQFIQRSALTVHQRVHTGEKPHHCEICAKRFSDSSSLARHRRTHSGKRPYKCPYADCQKTFTRRTTLNRHQNHHSGTIEEAAAATRAALAATGGHRASQAPSESEHSSNHGSPMGTPSPATRNMSMSPSVDLTGGNHLARQMNDGGYMQNGLPVHLRVGSPAGSTSSAGYGQAMRPTSHPTGYGPPSTLEPSLDQPPSGPTSVSGSPHMGSAGWQSPVHVPSPNSHNNNYMYADPGHSYTQDQAAMNQMYYGAPQQLRRPGDESGMVQMP